jgi:malate synthase
MARLEWRESVLREYPDVWTPEAVAACEALAPLNRDRLRLMTERLERRRRRAQEGRRIEFLDPDTLVPGTAIRVQDARDGRFSGPAIPPDLERQWIQGTGPATRPGAAGEKMASGLRNVAYALLSGADGWMFDGEDALGQVATMSLDNQRNLRLAIAGDRAVPRPSPSRSPAR